jgi:hypothetical protein
VGARSEELEQLTIKFPRALMAAVRRRAEKRRCSAGLVIREFVELCLFSELPPLFREELEAYERELHAERKELILRLIELGFRSRGPQRPEGHKP